MSRFDIDNIKQIIVDWKDGSQSVAYVDAGIEKFRLLMSKSKPYGKAVSRKVKVVSSIGSDEEESSEEPNESSRQYSASGYATPGIVYTVPKGKSTMQIADEMKKMASTNTNIKF